MTVAELQALLDALPGDMGVCVSSGQGCHHITRVRKEPRRRVVGWVSAAMDSVRNASTVAVDDRHPPMLVLEASAGAPLWCHAWADDVEFTLTGRWPAAVSA